MRRKLWIIPAGILLLAVFLYGIAMADQQTNTVYASQLAENSALALTADTTLIVDTDRTLSSVSGSYALTVKGDHVLSVDSGGHGISAASFTLNGGTVSIDSKKRGMSVSGNITVNGGMLIVDAGKDGINSQNGRILIKGGIVEARCGTNCYAIVAEKGNVDVTGGNVTARGAYHGIYTPEGSVTLAGNVTASGMWAVWAEHDIGVTSGTVSAIGYGFGLVSHSGSVTISGSVVAKGTEGDGAGGIYASQDVIINSGTVETLSALNGCAIESGHGDVIIAEGTTTTARGSMNGIKASEGSVTTAGSVTASGMFAIWAKKDIDVSSGSVSATGYGFGLVASTGYITISGDVIAKGTDGDGAGGMYAGKNVIIFSGNVEAFSYMNGSAIESGHGCVDVLGGTVTAEGSSYGMKASEGTMTLAGNITATGVQAAVWAKNDIEVTGGVLKARGNKAGIVSDSGSVTISGNVTAEAQINSSGIAVSAGQNILITGGPLIAIGKSKAVYAKNGTVTIQSPLAVTTPAGGIAGGHTITDGGETVTCAVVSVPVYTVSFSANGGSGYMNAVAVQAGSNYRLPSCLFSAPDGKRFRAWNYGAPGSSITVNQNILVTAIWEDDLFTVSFNPGDGTGSLSSVKVRNGSQYLTSNPSGAFTAPAGKTFDRWQISTGGTCYAGNRITITRDTVLTALWKTGSTEICEVSFDANGGGGSQSGVSVLKGAEYELGINPFTPPAGKTFHYWYADTLDGYYSPGDRITIPADTVLKAIWDAPYFTISFSANGHGTAPASVSVQEGADVWRSRPADPTADGYCFDGWFTDPACTHLYNFNAETMPSHNIILYAKWLPVIRDVRISGMKEPGVGQVATMLEDLSVPENAHYRVTNLAWMNAETYQVCAQPFRFEEGKQYYAQIDVYVEDGWAFSPVDAPVVPTPDFSYSDFDVFTLNGEDVMDLVVTENSYHCWLQTPSMTPAAVVEEGQCGDNLTYSINLSNGWLIISGTGPMWDYNYGDDESPFSDRPEIRNLIVEDGVTSIGSDAFYSCPNLVSVTIADSVVSIGSYAFQECPALTWVSLPGKITAIPDGAFGSCDNLESITIPESVVSIGAYAFTSTNLKTVTLPAKVNSVGYDAFYRCSQLTKVIVKNRNLAFGDSVFEDDDLLTLYGYGSSTTKTYAAAQGIPFKAIDTAPAFFLPDGLVTIEAQAFSGIAAEAVVIPASVTAIDGDPFRGSQVITVYGYNNTWKTWAESNGYAYLPME